MDTNWNRDFLPLITRNVETRRRREMKRNFIFFFFPTENAREILCGQSEGREDKDKRGEDSRD